MRKLHLLLLSSSWSPKGSSGSVWTGQFHCTFVRTCANSALPTVGNDTFYVHLELSEYHRHKATDAHTGIAVTVCHPPQYEAPGTSYTNREVDQFDFVFPGKGRTFSCG